MQTYELRTLKVQLAMIEYLVRTLPPDTLEELRDKLAANGQVMEIDESIQDSDDNEDDETKSKK